MQNLRINAERLWGTIIETAKIGSTAKGGISRLTLTDVDRQVRDWFVKACEVTGCTVTVDEMGNIFAHRPGRDESLPPIAIGSHLDTQPSGGKFDGVVGVNSSTDFRRAPNPRPKALRCFVLMLKLVYCVFLKSLLPVGDS